MRLSHPLYRGGEERNPLLAGHRPSVVWQRRGQGPHCSHLWGLRPSCNPWGPKGQNRLQGHVLPSGGVPSVWPRSKVQRKGGVECFGD